MGEVAEFARVFPDAGSAGRVLVAAGVPVERLPSWAVTDGLGFWSAVSGLLANGLIEDGRAALCAAALELFPANPVFRADAARSGSAAAAGGVVWSLPWPRNPHFTGREGELADLRARLVGDGRAVAVPQALHGLGGVGKTQLAVQYAYRHAGDYDLVWWVPAENLALVLGALAALADRVGVGVAGQADESVRAVVELLRQGGRFARWLLIVDNAETPNDLCGVLSAAGGGGHVLVTTRDPTWSRLAGTVEVDVLPRDRSVALLRERTPRLSVAEAERIAAAVDDLPLALEQAGAWLAETGMPAGEYVDLLRERVSEVMARGTPLDHVPVAATWTVALRGLDESAVLLVRLWAQFGPEPIPVDLIRPQVADLLPAPLDEAVRDPLALRDVVGTLVRAAMVRLVEGDQVVMHRLVHAVLRDDTPQALRPVLRRVAQGLLARGHPPDRTTPAGWGRYAQLYPHVLATGLLDTDSDTGRDFVLALAEALRDQGDYPTSRRIGEHVHDRWATSLGEDHRDTVRAAADLADTLWAQGIFPAARVLEEDVLVWRRRVLGEDHPDTIRAASNLAVTLADQGDYLAARALKEDVLARYRRVLGEDHPDTIFAASLLAVTLADQGDYLAARVLKEDALARYRRVLGEDHPDTIGAASNLAATVADLGDYPAARVLGEDVLARRRRVLGEDHPDTIGAASNLAVTLADQGDFPAARVLQEDVLVWRRRVLGVDHPETIFAASNLAVTLADQGDYLAARVLGEDALARCRRVLGEDHPDTIRAAANLAAILADLGDYPAARALGEDVLARRRRVLGEDHPATIRARASLDDLDGG
ncbi:FxSxx-COOH system tetratricopeptide repeat protein [Pseudofrankia saprophytica]|nr:FxSxx-COOH system tetratricopeptide repeat protein [Pseudofrankia saprophytica]